MTVSEFMFLGIGLVLGVASGVALIEIIRARPPSRREVHLTVSPNAIPRRRSTTLADDAFVAVGPEPARGGPADRRAADEPAPVGATDRRTNVLSDATAPAGQPIASRPPSGWRVGVPVSAGPDPMIGALRAGGAYDEPPRADAQPRTVPTMAARNPTARATAPSAVATLDPPATGELATTKVHSGPCAEERRLADERCELATLAQGQSAKAADALRKAQRAYDAHTAAAESAAEAGDPKNVRDLKESAQREFRVASRAASTPDAVEAAARAWLQQINQINREAAGAVLAAERGREAASSIGAGLDRLALQADAARIGAEMADAACIAARSAVADCDERGERGTTAPPTATTLSSGTAGSAALAIALEGGGVPRLYRLLRGDQDSMERLVAGLAGEDPGDQRRWKLAIGSLVDAIVADAIEESFLRFPDDHVFWGTFSLEQNRDITRALASLGHRFDGLGGWVDERVPSQRELSLALSYAGLDPMRIRIWPTEAQSAELFRSVEVAADEYMAGVAGDLTLAEMVDMLGRRADGLVELWNHWGRIRPMLLEDT